jgi:phenylpyruvate tautomerase PptA (4-oxalocrotonate tautomerase family)
MPEKMPYVEITLQKEWLLAEAKNKLTEVVNMALIATQIIKRRHDSVVVFSVAEYHRLIVFKTHLLSTPH